MEWRIRMLPQRHLPLRCTPRNADLQAGSAVLVVPQLATLASWGRSLQAPDCEMALWSAAGPLRPNGGLQCRV